MEKVKEKDGENGETPLFIIPKVEKQHHSSFLKCRNNLIHHSSANFHSTTHDLTAYKNCGKT